MAATSSQLTSTQVRKARGVRLAGFLLFGGGLAAVAASDAIGGEVGAWAGEPVAVHAAWRRLSLAATTEQASGVEIQAIATLTSDHAGFGGLSGLWLSPDASSMVAVSDIGQFWRARLEHDGTGRLTAIDEWSVADIPVRPGDPVGRQALDAEALSGDGRDGLVVAYEGHRRLRRLPLADLGARPQTLPVLHGLGGPSNSGIESFATLGDGRFLAIAERVGAWGGAGLWAWLIDGSTVDDLVYVPTPNFAPTGADCLGDTLYVVERQFSMLGGFQTRIVTLPVTDIKPGAHLRGRPLAGASLGDFKENFEAIAARRMPDGRTALYLLADDNFSFFQKTLLVQLALPADPDKVNRRPPAG